VKGERRTLKYANKFNGGRDGIICLKCQKEEMLAGMKKRKVKESQDLN